MALLGPKNSFTHRPGKVRRQAVTRSAEIIRVRDLPRRSLAAYTPEVAQVVSEKLRRPGSNFTLYPGQAAMLLEAASNGGLFSMEGVGAGKTTVAPLFGLAMGIKRVVLLVPPALKREIQHRVLPKLHRHFDFVDPKIVSYSELQTEKGARILDELRPDLIVADECHLAKNKGAARTKRLLRYMSHNPATKLVAMSGTVMRRSLRDFQHILALTHRGGGAPITRVWKEAEEWALALDPGVHESERLLPGALLEFTQPGENAREGFRRRLLETEGVIGGSKADCDASLVYTAMPLAVPKPVQDALALLRSKWELPSGELVVEALDFYRKARELAQGFYYEWVWPEGEPDREWLDARKAWRQAVASVTRLSRPGLDSELLVRKAAARELAGKPSAEEGRLPASSRAAVLEAFVDWEAVRERPEPPVRAVWIDDFLVRAGLRWAEQAEDALIWCESRAVQEKLAEIAPKALTAGAGTAGNNSIDALAASPRVDEDARAGTPCAVWCSYSHATGKNLQRWRKNLLLIPPAGGATWEQLVGRTHRPGQEADEVTVDFFAHTEELEEALRTATEQALALEQTTAARQKMLAATWVGFDPRSDQ